MTTTINPPTTEGALEKAKRLAGILGIDREAIAQADDPTNLFAVVELIDEVTSSVLHELKMLWFAEMTKAVRAAAERYIDRDVYAGKLVRMPGGDYIKVEQVDSTFLPCAGCMTSAESCSFSQNPAAGRGDCCPGCAHSLA